MSKTKTPKVALIFGTRPEIVKFSPIIRALEKRGADYVMIHSDQHYSYNMDQLFFKDLKLPTPHEQMKLSPKAKRQVTYQIGEIMHSCERLLDKHKPRHVLVQGDTNTVLAAAIAVNRIAVRRGSDGYPISLGHVEAGLRSYDRGMPEEANRVIADQLSDYLFAPTQHSKNILTAEGFSKKRIHVTGNTVVDAVHQNLHLAKSQSTVLKRLKLKAKNYMVMTLHRPENVDDLKRLKRLMQGVSQTQKTLSMPLVFPVHPRTKSRLLALGLGKLRGIALVDPLGYLDFLQLQSGAALLLTDSGGIQEEACGLKIPCVTLRDNTERPETVMCGSNALAGNDSKTIVRKAKLMVNKKRNWKQVYGTGNAGEKIIQILSKTQ